MDGGSAAILPPPGEVSNSHRLVVFAEAPFRPAALLVDAALRAASSHPGVEAVAVINTAGGPARTPLATAARGLAVDLTHRLINPEISVPLDRRWITGTGWVTRRHGFDLAAIPGQDVNALDFVERIRTHLRPTLALVFGSRQIFQAPLLRSTGRIVNYHNGLVPGYRGLRCTAWSIYNREASTGFTFHDMVPAIDEGPIVLQGSVLVEPGVGARRHEYRKTLLAAASIPTVLSRLVAGEPPVAQQGAGTYYSGAAAEAITTVDHPPDHTAEELQRRLLAFEALSIAIDGRVVPVTGLRRSRRSGAPLSFGTSDGIRLQPSRLAHLPPAAYSTTEWAGRHRQ